MSDGIPSKMGFISSPGATIFPLSSSLDVGMFTRPKPNCVFVRETVFTCLIVLKYGCKELGIIISLNSNPLDFRLGS